MPKNGLWKRPFCPYSFIQKSYKQRMFVDERRVQKCKLYQFSVRIFNDTVTVFNTFTKIHLTIIKEQQI